MAEWSVARGRSTLRVRPSPLPASERRRSSPNADPDEGDSQPRAASRLVPGDPRAVRGDVSRPAGRSREPKRPRARAEALRRVAATRRRSDRAGSRPAACGEPAHRAASPRECSSRRRPSRAPRCPRRRGTRRGRSARPRAGARLHPRRGQARERDRRSSAHTLRSACSPHSAITKSHLPTKTIPSLGSSSSKVSE